VVFNRLYTLANMPIQRFGSTLVSKGQFNDYMALLRASHRDENLDSVMCRSLVVDRLARRRLRLRLQPDARRAARARRPQARHLRDLAEAELTGAGIAVRDHCYGCTAGQGSSCGGALDA